MNRIYLLSGQTVVKQEISGSERCGHLRGGCQPIFLQRLFMMDVLSCLAKSAQAGIATQAAGAAGIRKARGMP